MPNPHRTSKRIQGNRIKSKFYLWSMKLTDYLSSVEDPRVVGRCKHKLSDILLIALITYLCGGEDYADMHQLAEERAEELSPLLELPNGLPSVDTFERVLGRINPSSLLECLNVYV